MQKVYFIGLDIAKNVFQVSMADKAGRQIANRKLSRANVLSFFANLEPCVIGLESCGTAHHWAREIGKPGHEVHLIQPIRAKAFPGNRNKTDAADARAICEALMHPGTRFVTVKYRSIGINLAISSRLHWQKVSRSYKLFQRKLSILMG